MTIQELQRRLRRIHASMGSEGRLSFTIGQGDSEPCYVTHWFPTGPAGFEDCKAVGVGTAEECLEALHRYAAAYRPRPTEDEVGRMLGVVTEPLQHYRIAAE